MARLVLAVCSLVVACASGRVLDSAWTPEDSVHVLDSVITAVNGLVKNPHLTADQLTKAKHLAEDIKVDVEAVENGNLTKQQAHDKVGEALKELSSYEAEMSHGTADKMAGMKKELAEKMALLAKTESMMKLLKLKKDLAEKKMMLQNLQNQKVSGGMAATGAMVNKLIELADSAKRNASALKVVNVTLQAREQTVQAELSNMGAAEKKTEDQINAIMKTQMPVPTQDKKDEAMDKGKNMLKLLGAQAHRKFAKARAHKLNDIKEIKAAEADIEKNDVPNLQKVLLKMQRETQGPIV